MTRRSWFARLAALVTGAAVVRSVPLTSHDLQWEYSRPIQPLTASEVARLFDVPVSAIDYNVMTYSEARAVVERRLMEIMDREGRRIFSGILVAPTQE